MASAGDLEIETDLGLDKDFAMEEDEHKTIEFGRRSEAGSDITEKPFT